jgi:nicotianamine synthase
MEAQNVEVAALVQKIAGLHAAIAKLPSLSPSPKVDALFTELVRACVPPSPVDVTKLDPEAQRMREELIRLCSDAEGHLEAHYSDMLNAFDNPLDHLGRFPYYSNYINLSKLEYDLLVRHIPDIAPSRVAFIGSGPLPFSSLVLAARHLPNTVFDNYDRSGDANDRARKLVRADKDLNARMSFHTTDVANLTDELGKYDVVFLAALVGMAAEDKAKVVAHLGRHMADGAALVVRSAHGARGFLYPIVDPEDIRCGGFDVLTVFHPDDEVINSVIVARKIDANASMEVAALVQKMTGLHAAITKLPSLSPSPEVDRLFTELVMACVPPSPVNVTKLAPAAQKMREELIRLCSDAEGHLEAHYSDMLNAFDNPLDHLERFPYYSNYINLSKLEYDLLVRYIPDIAPTRVAFVGSGPLPFSSLVLAARHLPNTVFDNYDRSGDANDRARKLVRANKDLNARMSFHTADVANLTDELGKYDVVFLAALVGMASEDKAKVVAHLGRHMANGAALVVRSAHGARGFLYPIVDVEDIRRGGFDVLTVYHPDDEVINSVIVARKIDANENMEVAALVQKMTGLHAAISKLPSLSPSPDVDRLFTELVMACVPPSPVDVTKLAPAAQKMREELIRLCSDAEGHLEAHYSDMLNAFDNPLDHLGRFPYFSNYINLSKLEYDLLVRYIPGLAPSRVAFVGSGPLPFSSLVLAARHLPNTTFDNYDRCAAANDRARKLVRADEDLRKRMSFHTVDVANLTDELGKYDVVFLAALVGMAAEDKAKVVAHLGKHMADGAALVVRSAHGARGFLYPIVDPEDIRRGGFDVRAVYHPDDEVINSVIIARKVGAHANGLQNGKHANARGAVPIVSPPCKCCKLEASALQKREEMAAKELSI